MSTHLNLVLHIYVKELGNGLSPVWRQAIIWTNAGILLIGPLVTNNHDFFNHNSCIFIHKNPFENVVCEMGAI